MLEPKTPSNEDERIKAIKAYDLTQYIDEEDFDFLTKMAAEICGTSISLISIILEDKQQFLSKYGMKANETSRDVSFCAHAINKPNEFFIVNDATQDDRFKDNPLVTGEPNIKFYAGKPLITESGVSIGTLCVIDQKSKELTAEQKSLLDSLSKQVMKLLELRKNQLETMAINERLRKNNTILKLTQKASNIGAWELDIKTDKVYWSDKIYEIHEIEKDSEHNKESALDFYHPDDRSNVANALTEVIETGKEFDIVNRLITAKGNEKWVRSIGRKIDNRVVGSFQDITKLKKNDLKYKAIFNSSFTFMGFLDINGKLLEVNRASLKIADINEKDVIGKLLWDCYWWEISNAAKNRLKQNLKRALNGEVVFYEEVLYGLNKIPMTILLSLKPLFDEKEKVSSVLAEGSNIQDVADVRKRFKLAIEGANIGTWEYNIQTGNTIYNERWASMLGYTLNELEPISIKTWQRLVHPEDLVKSTNAFQKYLNNDDPFYERENRMLHKDGHWVWILDRGKIFEWTEDKKPLMMYGIHQDISSRKKNQEALRVSEETFRGNFENAAIGMALIDTNGALYKINDKLCEMLGYTNEELLRIKLKEITHPEDFKNDTALLKKVISKDISNYKTEKRYYTKKGETVHTIVAISAVRDKLGEVLYFVAQLVDITQLKKVESEIKNLLDITQEQNNRLMNFAHVVSHNLRSHSSGIIGLLEIVENENRDLKENELFQLTHVGAKNLHKAVEELSNVVSNNFNRSEQSIIFLKERIDESIQYFLKNIEDENMDIINLVPESAKVWGIKSYINNVISNLISNALKYKSDDRKSFLKIYTEIKEKYTYLYFEDNGIGINLEKYKDQIFEMYKTFHSHEESRGVGLFIVKNQIESMKGEIEVKSTPGEGTTFIIKLPYEKN
jgi:PAS domain S-box-containing protein